jgi:hypothetical protein
MIYKTKCTCGCNERFFKLGLENLYIFYFEDCGEWWFKIRILKTLYSYSPCQGFTKHKVGD